MATARRRNPTVGIDEAAMETDALGGALSRLAQQRATKPGMDDAGVDAGVPEPQARTPGVAGPRVGDDGGIDLEPVGAPPAPPPATPRAPGVTPSIGGGPIDYGNVAGAEDLEWAHTNMPGFNTAEWGPGGDPRYHDNSYKNTFGKIATHFPPNPDGLRQLVASERFTSLFPNARLVDHPTDPKIDFGDGTGPVDVLFQTDKGWQWLPSGGGGGAADGAVGTAGGGDAGTPLPDGFSEGDDSILDEIMASIDAMAKGEEDPMAKKSIGTQLAELSEAARTSAGGALKGGTGSSANPNASRKGLTGRTGGVR